MDWQDQGVLLSSRAYGETAAIIEIFTQNHGRHAGVVRGGASRKMTPHLQPGTQLSVRWGARLESHLGTYTVEPLHSRTSIMSDRIGLATLTALTGLVAMFLPEREAHTRFYEKTMAFLDRLERTPDWQAYYIGWELDLLTELGFGLDLATCAVTGTDQDLIYVSPKSGRAVNRDAGADWANRLLTLPPFLRPEFSDTPISADDLRAGEYLTRYFLINWLRPTTFREALPPARDRLERAFARL